MKELIQESKTIIKQAKDLGCDKVIILVSSGKDSLCLADVVVKNAPSYGMDVFLAHHYIVEGLEVQEEVLQAMEARYGLKIHRYENSAPKIALMKDVLCINLLDNDMIHDMPMPKYRLDTQIDKALVAVAKTEWMTMGIKKADSMNRRYSLNEYPNPNPRKKRFYPLSNWSNKNVFDYCDSHKLPLSSLYKLYGRSFESLELESIYALKKTNIGDYNKVCDKYPLADALCWLYEKRIGEFGIKKIPRC